MKGSHQYSALTRLGALLMTASIAIGSAQERPQRIACVGASITEGTTNSDYQRNSWPLVLGRMLERLSPGEFEVGNFGSSGATLSRLGNKPYWEQDQFSASQQFLPDWVLINLGLNDSSPADWARAAPSWEQDLRDLVDVYRSLPSQPTVLLSQLTTLYPVHGGCEPCIPQRAEMNAIITKVAKDLGLADVDLGRATQSVPDWFPDGLHPNNLANERMAQAVAFALTGEHAGPDSTLHPHPVYGERHFFVQGGQTVGAHLGTWIQKDQWVEGTGARNFLGASHSVAEGDFHLHARLRMVNQENSAAGFELGGNFLGFEGARGTVFRKGPALGSLRLMHASPQLWLRDSWIDFDVIRNGDQVWFFVNNKLLEMALIPGPIASMGFDPTRSTMQVEEWSVIGTLGTKHLPQTFSIPIVDLDQDEGRHVLVDREEGQYLGHVTTELLEDGKTILAVYPKGHGRGPIVYKRSADGGKTWSERLPTPENWATSQEVPTLHRVIDPHSGAKRLILWSGLYPARLAVSEDEGTTWSELQPVGEWGGIVVMGTVARMRDGSYIALFHDDGRFFKSSSHRQSPPIFTLYQTRSQDGGLTWSEPREIWSGSELHLCEPGSVRSPDGTTLAVLLRENARRFNSHIIFTRDEGKTWSVPRELPASLTGDRHTPEYAPDGRLFMSFRDMATGSPTYGDWVGWVGTYDDLAHGTEGQYRIRIKDNKKGSDSTYPGVEVLPDGTFVVTTYGHWDEGEQPYILSARFTLEELDARVNGGE